MSAADWGRCSARVAMVRCPHDNCLPSAQLISSPLPSHCHHVTPLCSCTCPHPMPPSDLSQMAHPPVCSWVTSLTALCLGFCSTSGTHITWPGPLLMSAESWCVNTPPADGAQCWQVLSLLFSWELHHCRVLTWRSAGEFVSLVDALHL